MVADKGHNSTFGFIKSNLINNDLRVLRAMSSLAGTTACM